MREMKRLLTVCLCVMLVTTLMIPETAFAVTNRCIVIAKKCRISRHERAGIHRKMEKRNIIVMVNM